MTSDQAAKWAAKRVQGRWSFVWRTGVLQWGVIMFGVMGGGQIAQQPDRWLFLLELNLSVWLCAGVVFGLLTWHFSERSYAKYLAKQATSSNS
jgi:hypothetical protein